MFTVGDLVQQESVSSCDCNNCREIVGVVVAFERDIVDVFDSRGSIVEINTFNYNLKELSKHDVAG